MAARAAEHRRSLAAAALLVFCALLVLDVAGAWSPGGPSRGAIEQLSSPAMRDIHDVADARDFVDVSRYRRFSPFVDVDALSFGVVIDLGSSGSRAHIFYWRDAVPDGPEAITVRPAPDHPCLCDADDCTLQAVQCAEIEAGTEGELRPFWVKKVTPGVSAYAPSAPSAPPAEDGVASETAGESLRPLLQFAEELIPREKHDATPILLFATAGLRILPDEDVESILQSIRDEVHGRSSFRFQDDWCRVISGTDEALFGWVSIQEAVSLLDGKDGVPGNKAKTVGVVDQGGASVEMSFAPSSTAWSDDPAIAHYRRHALLEDGQHAVYVHSYLGYGLNEARKLYIKALIESGPAPPDDATEGDSPAVELDDPCYPRGAFYTYDGRGLHYTVSGTGDDASCRAQLQEYLFDQSTCSHDSCSFNNVYQPPLEEGMSFFALDKVATVVDFLGVPLHGEALSMLGDAGNEYCKLSTDELAERYGIPDEETAKKLYKTCFEAQFCYSLLTTGYGFSPESKQVRFVKQYSGVEMSWALGAMVELKEHNFVFVSSSSWGSSTLSSLHLWLMVLSAGGAIVLGAGIFAAGFFLHRRMRRRRMQQVQAAAAAQDEDYDL